jgi:hypothetical protein
MVRWLKEEILRWTAMTAFDIALLAIFFSNPSLNSRYSIQWHQSKVLELHLRAHFAWKGNFDVPIIHFALNVTVVGHIH